MKKLKSAIIALLVVTACALPSKADHEVPLKAKAAGQYTSRSYLMAPDLESPLPFPLDTPFVHITAEGVGHGTHLGKYTIQYDQYVQWRMLDGALTYIASGTWVATAANGDQLFGTFTNYQVVGQNGFTGDSTITGGTGRFAGMTGYETTVGEVVPDPSPAGLNAFSYEHDGWASSVGSNKKNN